MCNSCCIDFGKRYLKQSEISAKKVLEAGAVNVNGSLREFIQGYSPARYVGIDIVPGKGVDEICDVYDILTRFGPGSFDLVISTEMLEHVQDWRLAISNMKNVLSPGGAILITTRSIGFPYHPYPVDYWRFQPQDMNTIFADFIIESIEQDQEAPGVFIKAVKPQAFKEVDLTNYSVHPVKPS